MEAATCLGDGNESQSVEDASVPDRLELLRPQRVGDVLQYFIQELYWKGEEGLARIQLLVKYGRDLVDDIIGFSKLQGRAYE